MKTITQMVVMAAVLALAGCGGCGQPAGEAHPGDTTAAADTQAFDLDAAATEAGLDARQRALLESADQPLPEYGTVTRDNLHDKLDALETEMAAEAKK